MRQHFSKVLMVLVATGALLFGNVSYALTCPNPSDLVCLLEPQDDDEFGSNSVQVTGAFASNSVLESVVDFFISFDSLTDPLFGSSDFFIPDLLAVKQAGQFQKIFSAVEDGLFNISAQSLILNDNGGFDNVEISRRVFFISQPRLTVTNARVPGAANNPDCSTQDPACFGVTQGIVSNPAIDRSVQITPPNASVGVVELCVKTPEGESNTSGSEVTVTADNTITDGNRSVTVHATCGGEGFEPCSFVNDSFCPGGFVVSVPLGHGENAITLFAENSAANDAEVIQIDPFTLDRKGPALCVNYLDETSQPPLQNVDNKTLLVSESELPMIDVTLGACGQASEAIAATPPDNCDPESPPACNGSPVCLQSNNQKDGAALKSVAMCTVTVGGQAHYLARLAEVRYPVNTVTLLANDNAGNQTVETHAFGFGNIRPLFTGNSFNLNNALIPDAIGGAVPLDFIKGKLLPVVRKVVASKKFQDETFFTLLDPKQPSDAEIDCLKAIESSAQCTYDHLASKSRVVAFKVFCDSTCQDEIGDIEIPDDQIVLLDNERIRAQVKIKGLHGRAEMYTMKFNDTDGDGEVDTNDDDDDGDEILDEDELDDDNDGVLDEDDLPGILVNDPDFSDRPESYPTVIPLNLTTKQITLNIEAQLIKDSNGALRVSISKIPGRKLVEVVPDNKNALEFDCNRNSDDDFKSEIHSGGKAGQLGNGISAFYEVDVCNALKSLNNAADGLPDNATNADRALQGTIKQLRCTLEGITRCSIPKRLETALDEFETQPVTSASLELLGRTFNIDVFAPLGSATVDVRSNGIGFKGEGLLAPAGVEIGTVQSAKKKREYIRSLPKQVRREARKALNASGINIGSKFDIQHQFEGLLDRFPDIVRPLDDILNLPPPSEASVYIKDLPSQLKNSKFGTLSQASDGSPLDPIDIAFGVEEELNLAVNEEMVNSVLHTVTTLLFDLSQKEEALQLPHQLLDLSKETLTRDFGLSVRDPSDGKCKDENGVEAADDFTCFPFPLVIENIFGPVNLKYVDFDNDGLPGEDEEKQNVPVLIRNQLNPFIPPVVKFVSASFLDDVNPAAGVRLEVEVGLGQLQMSLFEEKSDGSGEIKSWCDNDRFPDVSPGCPNKVLPIVKFGVSGRVTATIDLSVQDGVISVDAGLSSLSDDAGALNGLLDDNKTYLDFAVLENNTIVPEKTLIDSFENQIGTILRDDNYVFAGNKQIHLDLPAQLPLDAFCETREAEFPEICDCLDENSDGDGCSLVTTIEDLFDDLGIKDFGVDSLTLTKLVSGIEPADGSAPRYLTTGVGVDFDLASGGSSGGGGFNNISCNILKNLPSVFQTPAVQAYIAEHCP